MALENGAASEKTLLSQPPGGERHGVGAKGLSLFTVVWFIVGATAGSGLMGLPHALLQIGWVGVAVMIALAVGGMYTGHILGRCQVLIRERCGEQTELLRYPYPAIGHVSYGPKLRILISVFLDVTMLGESVVFLLLAAENTSAFLHDFHVHVSACCLMVVIVVVLCPVCWCGTPKDFWPLAICASSTMLIASVLLVATMLEDVPKRLASSYHVPFKWDKFLMSFGTIFYAYGTHPSFPTFQTDMKQPQKFTTVVLVSFTVISVVYLLISIEGYLVYGSTIQDNLLLSVAPGPLLSTVQVLITLHLFCTFVMALNPVSQEAEELLNIPPSK
ncbi:amino acid transporter, transmembrane family-containing protein [Elysia marginata]|uniref:Amino acid transporter, transmembrane family-containing protein n=1 Tax=Elysia marginata TaxID=1093978 RepID=A0AAV4GSJ9_9GAST|nr:amino acid transporter, transmembrane family-containing protein [Elysia marginata]